MVSDCSAVPKRARADRGERDGGSPGRVRHGHAEALEIDVQPQCRRRERAAAVVGEATRSSVVRLRHHRGGVQRLGGVGSGAGRRDLEVHQIVVEDFDHQVRAVRAVLDAFHLGRARRGRGGFAARLQAAGTRERGQDERAPASAPIRAQAHGAASEPVTCRHRTAAPIRVTTPAPLG